MDMMKNDKCMPDLVSLFANMTIKSKIFIFYSGILLLSVSLFVVATIQISNRAIVAKATKNAERELALISKSLMNLINNSENDVRILSIDNRLQKQLTRIENNEMDSIDILEVEQTLSTVISNVVHPITHMAAGSIISSEGTFFDIGYVDNSSIIPVFDTELIESITHRKTPVWEGPIKIKYKDNSCEDVFAVAKTVIQVDTGHILGTAILYLKETGVASIYLDNIVSKNDKFYIINDDMEIISTQNKDEIYTKFDEKKYLGNYKIDKLSEGKSIIRNIEGTQTLVTVTDFKKNDWKIISLSPLDELTSENEGIKRLLIILGITCLVFAFGASYLLSYSISKPILELANVMKGIRSGNLNLRADLKTKDEIGILGDGFNSLMDRINGLMAQIYYEQKEKRENEFKLLQSQVKPHFLYNTIETIISFIKLGLYDNAMQTAKSLAGFYRISLSKGDDIILIEDEKHLIENYLSIQKLRYVESLEYELDFSQEILKYQIPKLTLQPLVENAIYHGLREKEGKGRLIIKGYLEKCIINIEVIDDGVGMTEKQIKRVLNRSEKNKKNMEFGIFSVDSRLKLLYGEQYGVSIESRVREYTKVIIKLPAMSG